MVTVEWANSKLDSSLFPSKPAPVGHESRTTVCAPPPLIKGWPDCLSPDARRPLARVISTTAAVSHGSMACQYSQAPGRSTLFAI